MKTHALVVDAIASVIYLLAASPAITGIPIHEWLGLVAFVALVVHCATHYDWLARSLRLIFSHPISKRTGRYVLDVLTGLTLVVCVLSGVFISGTVLPAFGLFATGYFFWDPLHSASAKLLLALIVVHVALNVHQVYVHFTNK